MIMNIDSNDPPRAGNGAALEINSPIGSEQLDLMIAGAIEQQPAFVVDHGCGWGEVLLRTLAALPNATGVGIDVHGPDIVRGQGLAQARGLADRVRLVEGSSGDFQESADLLINIGAFHAFGSLEEALTTLRGLLNPGGRLLFGFDYWQQTPTSEQLAQMWEGTTVADCHYLADVTDLITAAGWRIFELFDSTPGEWDHFEGGQLRDREEWLVAHPSHPEAGAVREALDQERSRWLRGTRNVMGFAVVLLG